MNPSISMSKQSGELQATPASTYRVRRSQVFKPEQEAVWHTDTCKCHEHVSHDVEWSDISHKSCI